MYFISPINFVIFLYYFQILSFVGRSTFWPCSWSYISTSFRTVLGSTCWCSARIIWVFAEFVKDVLSKSITDLIFNFFFVYLSWHFRKPCHIKNRIISINSCEFIFSQISFNYPLFWSRRCVICRTCHFDIWCNHIMSYFNFGMSIFKFLF